MHISLNSETGLYLLRRVRAAGASLEPGPFEPPDPHPFRTWTRRRIAELLPDVPGPMRYMVKAKRDRMNTAGAVATVYSDLPPGSALIVDDSVSIACPELLFVEIGRSCSLAQQVLFGYELCGTYALTDPCAFRVPPVTDVSSIRRYLDTLSVIRGLPKARKAIRYVLDNAWSPMEAILATILRLPVSEGGYGFTDIVLNQRTPAGIADGMLSFRESRVPDIQFGETSVGINYDGEGHLDLHPIIDAAKALALDPSDQDLLWSLEGAKRSFRETYVDDRRRERDLWQQRMTVFTATKEDLYQHGALDRLVLQVLEAMRRADGADVERMRETVLDRELSARRETLLFTLLP